MFPLLLKYVCVRSIDLFVCLFLVSCYCTALFIYQVACMHGNNSTEPRQEMVSISLQDSQRHWTRPDFACSWKSSSWTLETILHDVYVTTEAARQCESTIHVTPCCTMMLGKQILHQSALATPVTWHIHQHLIGSENRHRYPCPRNRWCGSFHPRPQEGLTKALMHAKRYEEGFDRLEETFLNQAPSRRHPNTYRLLGNVRDWWGNKTRELMGTATYGRDSYGEMAH